MRFDRRLLKSTFLCRPNRFVVRALLDGDEVTAHLANSGRLHELLHPGNTLLLARAPEDGTRRTAYDLVLIEVNGVLVSADARLPNALFAEALGECRLQEFQDYASVRREVGFGDSRLDFMLSGRERDCYVEVKSVTLVEDGVGLFPDAPTTRGRKHVGSLVGAIRAGYRAAAVFVVQRPDVRSFSPNENADPDFCGTLRDAAEHGLEVYAYRCEVDRAGVELADQVTIDLGRGTNGT